ncbi:MAG: type II toxin-antitoxin system HicA family toxin [Phycisphaerales bacterium]
MLWSAQCQALIEKTEGVVVSFKRMKVVRALERRGYLLVRDVGPHSIYRGANGVPIAVPRHRELNRYTVKAIAEDAGAEWNEFRKEVS